MSDSTGWDALPAALRDGIAAHTGPVTGAEPHGEGLSTAVRLVLHTASGLVFVKGTGPDSTDHQRQRLALGAAMAPYMTAVSPPLLFEAEADGWHVTGWPALPGRPWADQKPGSPDLPLMTGLLTELATIPAPDVLTRTARAEWQRWAHDPAIFDGDALVHRDPNPTNFVVDDDRAWIVDLGWTCRGPAWLTSAQLVLSLIEAGWEPGDAENALMPVPAWHDAAARAIDEHAAANARMWDDAAETAPTRIRRFRRDIAHTWAAYRTGTQAWR